jgi:AcrR family transcriptional regulator
MPTIARPDPAEGATPYHHGDLRRALVDAALALVTEEQNWGFSLREVARRAGVSHNAPYKHFADKRDLLAAVAAAGFEAVRARLATAVAETRSADAALAAIGVAYVRFGLANPAHYRLMFGPTLTTGEGGLPAAAAEAAAGAKAVLQEAVLRGAQAGYFTPSPASQAELDQAALAAWSLVHGLTMLAIDGLAGAGAPSSLPDAVVEGVARALIDGLRRR